jgi:GTP:adenosylcobinamide-phosphate guanylyltransferase
VGQLDETVEPIGELPLTSARDVVVHTRELVTSLDSTLGPGGPTLLGPERPADGNPRDMKNAIDTLTGVLDSTLTVSADLTKLRANFYDKVKDARITEAGSRWAARQKLEHDNRMVSIARIGDHSGMANRVLDAWKASRTRPTEFTGSSASSP